MVVILAPIGSVHFGTIFAPLLASFDSKVASFGTILGSNVFAIVCSVIEVYFCNILARKNNGNGCVELAHFIIMGVRASLRHIKHHCAILRCHDIVAREEMSEHCCIIFSIIVRSWGDTTLLREI